MRIVYLATARIPGERASALQIAHTCAALAAAGGEVHLVTRKVPPGEDLFAFYGLQTRFQVHRLPTLESPRLFSLSYRLLLLATLIRLRCRLGPLEVLYTREPGIVGMLAPLLGLLGARLVLEIRELTGDELRPGTRTFRRHAAAFGHAVGISVGSEKLRGDLSALYALPPDRVAVIPNGCGWAGDGEAFRGQGEFRIVYTGQMYTWKGADLLLEAFATLADLPRARLVMVGGFPDDLARLRALATRLGLEGRVTFTGFLPPLEAARHQRGADVLVIPTLDTESGRYALTVKVFEYMATGRPIVATRIPPNEEVLVDGETALLAAPEAGALGAVLRRLAVDPALGERLGSEARRRALDAYSWERRGQLTLAFIRARIGAAA